VNAQRRARVYTVRWTPTRDCASRAVQNRVRRPRRDHVLCVAADVHDHVDRRVSWRSVTYINY